LPTPATAHSSALAVAAHAPTPVAVLTAQNRVIGMPHDRDDKLLLLAQNRRYGRLVIGSGALPDTFWWIVERRMFMLIRA
jgi:hypothetical protein